MPSIRGSAWEQSATVPAVTAQPYRHSVGVHRQVQLAVEPPFVRAMAWLPPRAPGAVGMGLDVAGVKHQPFIIRVIHHRLQQPGPDVSGPRQRRSGGGCSPVPVVRGQIPPGGAGAQNPEHGVDETAVILGRPGLSCPCRRGRRGSKISHTRSEISWRRCAGATATAGIAQSCCTNCNISLLSHSHFDDTP